MVQHKNLEKYIRVKAEKVIVYAVIVIRQIFLIQMKYSLQSMYNHMLGANRVSYISLLFLTPWFPS